MSKGKTNATVKTSVRPQDVSRVQGSIAKQNGGEVPKGSYVGRMQKTIAKRT